MRTRFARLLLLTAALILLAGCGGATEPAPEPTPAQAAQQPTAAPAAPQATEPPVAAAPTKAPTPTQAPAPTATEAPAPTAESAETGDESVTIESREAGLDQLPAYRARFSGTWKTTDGDKSQDATWDWEQEYTADPEALHLKMATTGGGASADMTSIEIWQFQGSTYMQTTDESGETQCFAISSEGADPISNSMFNPGSLGQVQGARYVGTETVNGIRAKHYTYDEKAMVLTGATQVKGEMWVAIDGGYVVKDTTTWQGSGLLGLGSGDEGEGTWTWEILDVNPDRTIAPPENCESAAGELPVLPDAAEKSTFGDMMSYKTGVKLPDAAKFYQDEMDKAGWKAQESNQVSEEFAMLGFEKDGQTVQVMLSPDGDQTSVIVMVQTK